MPQTRRILACDGGGIRGIITLHCLKALEERLGVERLCLYFDMFAGTSTGAMIAGSLASGARVSEIIDAYVNDRRRSQRQRRYGSSGRSRRSTARGRCGQGIARLRATRSWRAARRPAHHRPSTTVRAEASVLLSVKVHAGPAADRVFSRYGSFHVRLATLAAIRRRHLLQSAAVHRRGSKMLRRAPRAEALRDPAGEQA